jgi:hypothetical protein
MRRTASASARRSAESSTTSCACAEPDRATEDPMERRLERRHCRVPGVLRGGSSGDFEMLGRLQAVVRQPAE